MPIVEMPDGTRVQFPDDMPREQIKGMIASKFPDAATSAVPPNTAMDVLKSGASGIARGAAQLAGLPGTISDAIDRGYDWMTGSDSSAKRAEIMGFEGNPLSGQKVQSAMSRATGGATEYQPKTTAGEYAATAGEFLPGAAAFGGASAGNLAKFGLLPAAASETAGQATKGTAAEPYARTVAALAAPALPSMARRAITPNPITPERARLVSTMEREGIPLTAGQKTGVESLKYKEAVRGGQAAANIAEKQGEAFTKAILKRAGVNASRATPEVMDDAFKTIGNKFDDLASRHNITPDRKLVTDIRDTVQSAKLDIPATELPGRVNAVAGDILSKLKTGSMTGDQYQKLSSALAKYARGSSNSAVRDVYYGLRSALDDAFERSIIKSGNLNDLGKMKTARNEYRNLLVIEEAAARQGAQEGIISPTALRSIVTRKAGRRSYVRGKGDFADLARAGSEVMKPLPQSGTAPRTLAGQIVQGVPTGIGASVGFAVGGFPGAVAGGLAGAAAPALTGRAMLSAPGRAYLGNQLLQPGNVQLPLIPAATAPGLLAGPR